MKFNELIEELEETSVFKDFKSKNESAYLSAGFFIIDLKESTNKIQIDYFLPSKSKLVGFEHPFKEAKVFEDEISPMKELSKNPKIDINDLESKSLEVIKENNSALSPTKIIAILKEDIWNLTCMDDMLGIIRMHIDAKTGNCIDFNKGSLMDFASFQKGKKK